ncbi:hypothetical protein LTR86_005566 [Recurvomyces mirabilis]|nr:hypothetical protein LTR86_005566 [Recurvomyces mirabilis]
MRPENCLPQAMKLETPGFTTTRGAKNAIKKMQGHAGLDIFLFPDVSTSIDVTAGSSEGTTQSWPIDSKSITNLSTTENDQNRASGGKSFLDLPLELRKLVYGYLIQTKCTFYFSALHYPAGYNGQHTATLTKIMPPGSLVHDRITLLLSTSQQIQAECYATLYGENTFVFREATTPINETVLVSDHADRLDVWTKVFKDVTPDPLWPLTSATLPHVKSIRLLLFAKDGPHAANFKGLKLRTDHLARLLSQCLKLRTLDITLSRRREGCVSHRYRGQPISMLTELAHDMSISVDEMTGSIFLGPSERGFGWDSTPEQKQYILEPLRHLYGIKEVAINGFVEPEFAARLSSVMMSDERVDLPTLPAVGATKLVRRKMPGRAKKKLTQQAVLQYWEPTLEWEAILVIETSVS